MQNAELSAKRRELLLQPDFFGHFTVTYERGRMRSYWEDDPPIYYPYRIVDSGDSWVEVEKMNPHSGEMETLRLLLVDGRLWVPVDWGFYEIFDRLEGPPANLDDRIESEP